LAQCRVSIYNALNGGAVLPCNAPQRISRQDHVLLLSPPLRLRRWYTCRRTRHRPGLSAHTPARALPTDTRFLFLWPPQRKQPAESRHQYAASGQCQEHHGSPRASLAVLIFASGIRASIGARLHRRCPRRCSEARCSWSHGTAFSRAGNLWARFAWDHEQLPDHYRRGVADLRVGCKQLVQRAEMRPGYCI